MNEWSPIHKWRGLHGDGLMQPRMQQESTCNEDRVRCFCRHRVEGRKTRASHRIQLVAVKRFPSETTFMQFLWHGRPSSRGAGVPKASPLQNSKWLATPAKQLPPSTKRCKQASRFAIGGIGHELCALLNARCGPHCRMQVWTRSIRLWRQGW